MSSLHSACIPALGVAGWNAYRLWNEHWEHWSHMPPLEERVEYSYQNIRTKNYAWGDGDKVRFRRETRPLTVWLMFLIDPLVCTNTS
jgi:cytochrome c oxidase subunit VIa